MGRAPRHPVLREVLRSRRETRAAFQDYLEAQVNAADEACVGILLNELGRFWGVDPASLFLGNAARAHRYASQELLEWWLDHPRITFTEWERQSGVYSSGEWGIALQEAF